MSRAGTVQGAPQAEWPSRFAPCRRLLALVDVGQPLALARRHVDLYGIVWRKFHATAGKGMTACPGHVRAGTCMVPVVVLGFTRRAAPCVAPRGRRQPLSWPAADADACGGRGGRSAVHPGVGGVVRPESS